MSQVFNNFNNNNLKISFDVRSVDGFFPHSFMFKHISAYILIMPMCIDCIFSNKNLKKKKF